LSDASATALACPRCGRPVPADARFCMVCGNPRTLGAPGALPAAPLPSPVLPNPPTFYASSPATGYGLGTATASSRPIRPDEEEWLRRRASSPAAGIPRVLGALFGLGALLMGLGLFVGFPWDLNVFPYEEIFLTIAAVACAGVSYGIRAPMAHALREGQVTEVQGLPTWEGPAFGGLEKVRLGPFSLLIPKTLLTAGPSPLALGWVTTSQVRTIKGWGAATEVQFLSVNGAMPPRSSFGYLVS